MEELKGISVIEIEKDRAKMIGMKDGYLYVSNSERGSVAIGSKYHPYSITEACSKAIL